MARDIRNALVRVFSMDLTRNHGNVVVAEILFRRVSFTAGSNGETDAAGAVLIDNDGSLGPISTGIRAGINLCIAIRKTDELLWVPIRADLSPTAYWTVELVPLIEYARSALKSDEAIIASAHRANEQ